MVRFCPVKVCHLTKDCEPGSGSNEPSGRSENKRAEMAATGCRPFSSLVARETIELVLLSIGQRVCPPSKCTVLKPSCREFYCSVVGGGSGLVEPKQIGNRAEGLNRRLDPRCGSLVAVQRPRTDTLSGSHSCSGPRYASGIFGPRAVERFCSSAGTTSGAVASGRT